jgi:hypothetical protein
MTSIPSACFVDPFGLGGGVGRDQVTVVEEFVEPARSWC